MIRRFRSFIVALALLVSFTVYDTRNASAIVDPFTAYVVASAVIHAVIIGGAYVGYKYYKKENGGSRDANGTKVTPNGTIGRDATVTWVDISTGVPEIKSKNVTAKVSHDKLKTAVKSNPSKYPKLINALSQSLATDISSPSLDSLNSLSVGSIVIVNSGSYPGNYSISNKTVSSTSLSSSYTTTFHDSGYPVTRSDGTYGDRIYVPTGPPSGISTPYNLYILSGNKYSSDCRPPW